MISNMKVIHPIVAESFFTPSQAVQAESVRDAAPNRVAMIICVTAVSEFDKVIFANLKPPSARALMCLCF